MYEYAISWHSHPLLHINYHSDNQLFFYTLGKRIADLHYKQLIVHDLHTLLTEEICHPILGNGRSQGHDENSQEDGGALYYAPLEVRIKQAHGCLHEGNQQKDD